MKEDSASVTHDQIALCESNVCAVCRTSPPDHMVEYYSIRCEKMGSTSTYYFKTTEYKYSDTRLESLGCCEGCLEKVVTKNRRLRRRLTVWILLCSLPLLTMGGSGLVDSLLKPSKSDPGMLLKSGLIFLGWVVLLACGIHFWRSPRKNPYHMTFPSMAESYTNTKVPITTRDGLLQHLVWPTAVKRAQAKGRVLKTKEDFPQFLEFLKKHGQCVS